MGARTLFATHYHELNALADLYPRIVNYKVDVREYEGKVVFLHTVTPGTADHSYGIQVAEMAGLPAAITERASVLLKNLERSGLSVHGDPARTEGAEVPEGIQLTLFGPSDHAVRDALVALDVNAMTPLQALAVLASLKDKAKEP